MSTDEGDLRIYRGETRGTYAVLCLYLPILAYYFLNPHIVKISTTPQFLWFLHNTNLYLL